LKGISFFYEYNIVSKMQSISYDMLIKILVIGESGVGKSSLLSQYTENYHNPNHISTIGIDFKIKQIYRKNKEIKLQLWDTAGQERFRTITSSYYRGSHAIMLVYDVTERVTFEKLSTWLEDIQRYCTDDVQIILVGNKTDLSKRRVVGSEEAEEYALHNNLRYIETSVVNHHHIDEAFHMIVDATVDTMNLLYTTNGGYEIPNQTHRLLISNKSTSCCAIS